MAWRHAAVWECSKLLQDWQAKYISVVASVAIRVWLKNEILPQQAPCLFADPLLNEVHEGKANRGDGGHRAGAQHCSCATTVCTGTHFCGPGCFLASVCTFTGWFAGILRDDRIDYPWLLNPL